MLSNIECLNRYSYNEHGRCPYYGLQLLTVEETRKDQYRVTCGILVRNSDGLLGFCGSGVKWALNFVTNSGASSFNPISENSIEWSKFHNAYIRRSQKEHFRYPVIVGEYYTLKDGVKRGGTLYAEETYPTLPKQ